MRRIQLGLYFILLLVIVIAIVGQRPPVGVMLFLMVPLFRNLIFVVTAKKKRHQPYIKLVALNGVALLLAVLFVV